MIWSIAWRNIWRNKTRSLVVILAVCLGLIGGLFSVGVTIGMVDQRVETAIKTETSHLQLHNPKFVENKETKYFINDAGKVADYIRKVPEVEAVCIRSKIITMASTAETGTGVMVIGIDPEQEKKVTDIYTKMKSGSYFGEKRRNPVVISQKLADKLKVKERSKIILTFQRTDGYITGGAFRVVGIYRTGNAVFDEMNIFVRHSDIAELAGFDKNQAHEIAVLLKDNDDETLKTAKDKLTEKYKNLEVSDWKEIQPEVGLMLELMNISLYTIMIIILLALAFGIINTMLMAVFERVREIGMLMAIGMNQKRIFNMVVLETVFLSFTGAIVGMVLSALIIAYFFNTGIDISSVAGEAMESIGYSPVIYPVVGINFYISLSALVITMAILSSIWPARKAIKLQPAEAIRQE